MFEFGTHRNQEVCVPRGTSPREVAAHVRRVPIPRRVGMRARPLGCVGEPCHSVRVGGPAIMSGLTRSRSSKNPTWGFHRVFEFGHIGKAPLGVSGYVTAPRGVFLGRGVRIWDASRREKSRVPRGTSPRRVAAHVRRVPIPRRVGMRARPLGCIGEHCHSVRVGGPAIMSGGARAPRSVAPHVGRGSAWRSRDLWDSKNPTWGFRRVSESGHIGKAPWGLGLCHSLTWGVATPRSHVVASCRDGRIAAPAIVAKGCLLLTSAARHRRASPMPKRQAN